MRGNGDGTALVHNVTTYSLTCAFPHLLIGPALPAVTPAVGKTPMPTVRPAAPEAALWACVVCRRVPVEMVPWSAVWTTPPVIGICVTGRYIQPVETVPCPAV